MKKIRQIELKTLFIFILFTSMHTAFSQHNSTVEADCVGFQREESQCFDALEECFSCILQQGIVYYTPDQPDQITLLNFQQMIRQNSIDYKLTVSTHELQNVRAKTTLNAHSIWFKRDVRENQSCILNSIFYVLSDEDFFAEKMFILRNGYIFVSPNVYHLEDKFEEPLNFKAVVAKYCVIQP